MPLSASFWLRLPATVVYGVGTAGAIAMVLVSLRFASDHHVPSWWIIFLPVIMALASIFLLFLGSIVLSVTAAIRLGSGHVEPGDEGTNFDLPLFFDTMKTVILGFGYTLLLLLAVWLLLIKLESDPKFPVIYPLLPVIILGSLHLFLAIMFKEPEIDAGRSTFIGVSMLSHAIMLTLKLDHYKNSANLPWAAVFAPSWFTYGGVLVVCGFHGLIGCRRLLGASENAEAPSSSSDKPQAKSTKDLRNQLRVECIAMAGMIAWAIGFATSQVIIVLELDGMISSIRWEVVLLPALIGWATMTLCLAPRLKNTFREVIMTFLDFYGVVAAESESDTEDPRKPLLERRATFTTLGSERPCDPNHPAPLPWKSPSLVH